MNPCYYLPILGQKSFLGNSDVTIAATERERRALGPTLPCCKGAKVTGIPERLATRLAQLGVSLAPACRR